MEGVELEELTGKRKTAVLAAVHACAREICFMLSIPFRAQTSKIYLNSLGYSRDILSLLNQDPGKLLEENKEFRNALSKIESLIEKIDEAMD